MGANESARDPRPRPRAGPPVGRLSHRSAIGAICLAMARGKRTGTPARSARRRQSRSRRQVASRHRSPACRPALPRGALLGLAALLAVSAVVAFLLLGGKTAAATEAGERRVRARGAVDRPRRPGPDRRRGRRQPGRRLGLDVDQHGPVQGRRGQRRAREGQGLARDRQRHGRDLRAARGALHRRRRADRLRAPARRLPAAARARTGALDRRGQDAGSPSPSSARRTSTRSRPRGRRSSPGATASRRSTSAPTAARRSRASARRTRSSTSRSTLRTRSAGSPRRSAASSPPPTRAPRGASATRCPNARLSWADGGALFRIDPGGPVKRSDDGGETWEDVGSTGGEPRALHAKSDRGALRGAARRHGQAVDRRRRDLDRSGDAARPSR